MGRRGRDFDILHRDQLRNGMSELDEILMILARADIKIIRDVPFSKLKQVVALARLSHTTVVSVNEPGKSNTYAVVAKV